MRVRRTIRLGRVVALCIGVVGCAPADRADLAIQGATVVNVIDGSLTVDQTVLINDRRITAIGASSTLDASSAAQVIDGSGKYLIPGLWDMHGHVFLDSPETDAAMAGIPIDMDRYEAWEQYDAPVLDLLIANGVTGLRDMWGDADVIRQVKAQRSEGRRLGPRFVAPGHFIDGPGGPFPGYTVVTTPAEGRAAVDSVFRNGADFIKVVETLAPEVYQAILAQARVLGIPVAGHAPRPVGVNAASDAGQRSIEHTSGLLAGCVRQAAPDAQRSIDRSEDGPCAQMARRLVANGTWLVPTLVVDRGFASMRDPDFVDDPRKRFVHPSFLTTWAAESNPFVRDAPESVWTRLRESYALAMEVVGFLHQRGVTFLAGSDFPNAYAFAGFGVHDEMSLLVEAGLTPHDALRAATVEPARFLDAADSLGTVDDGKLADLVLLDANPLLDISNSRRIHAVVVDGRLLGRAQLDSLLAGVVTAYAAPGR